MSGIKPIVAQIARYIMAAMIGWNVFSAILKDDESVPDKAVSVMAAICEIMLLAAGGFWG